MITKEQAVKLLNIYGRAWMTRDPELICTIFTEDATYNDPHEPGSVGREAIHNYWIAKVVGEQKDIIFNILNVWVDGNTVIAEWSAKFTDIKRNLRIDMTEVAIFTAQGDKFSAVREYYKTIKAPI